MIKLLRSIESVVIKIFFVTLCGLLFISSAEAQNPSVENGLSWLKSAQKTDGSWGALNNFRDTSTVLESYRFLGQSDPSYQNALGWLSGVTLESNDFLTRRLKNLSGTGTDLSADIQKLLSSQNADGGWGYYPGFDSDVLDTVTGLNAFDPALLQYRTPITRGVSYLVAKQNSDGSWSLTPDGAGDVTVTSLIVALLKTSGNTLEAAAAVGKAVAWLATKQNPDGGFGSSPSTIHDTVYAVTALMVSGNLQAQTLSNAFTYMTGNQLPNGSWDENAYETALALKTLGNIKPNLSVFQSDLTVSNTAPKSGEKVTIRAIIRNAGSKDAANVPVQFSVKTSDGIITKIGAPRIIPLLIVGTFASEELVFDTAGKQGPFEYTVTVDPENTITELSKDDNQASVRVSVIAVPDLMVSSDTIVLSKNAVSIGDEVTVTATISNQGTLSAQNVEINFYHDAPAPGNLIATGRIDSLDPGQAAVRTAVWKTSEVGSGIKMYAVIDPRNMIDEFVKDNNQASKPVDVAAVTEANLAIAYSDITFTPATAKQGESVTITALTHNQGFSEADNVDVAFYKGVPGQDGVLLGYSTVPAISTGGTATASWTWSDIAEAGGKVIYVKVDPSNKIQEFNKTDNDAFAVLQVLSSPDLAVSSSSIAFNPTMPKIGDNVAISAAVQNKGDQPASNVIVSAMEGNVTIGSQAIPSMAGNSQAMVSFAYNTTGQSGLHEITIIVDPENIIGERNRSNNSASKSFSVQNSDIWVTEKYISPNGDGVKDTTEVFFRLDVPETVSVSIMNNKKETVRTFSGSELQNSAAGTILWDGFNDAGTVVNDGDYQVQVKSSSGTVLKETAVIVDTNRSTLLDALTAGQLAKNDLSCIQNDNEVFYYGGPYVWLPDGSGILYYVEPYYGWWPTDHEGENAGLHIMSPDGKSIQKITSDDWLMGKQRYIDRFVLSPDGRKIAIITKQLHAVDCGNGNYYMYPNELWVMDIDGNNLKLLDSREMNSLGDCYADVLRYDLSYYDDHSSAPLGWSSDSTTFVYYVNWKNGNLFWSTISSGIDVMTANVETGVKTKIIADIGFPTGGYPWYAWSPDGNSLALLEPTISSWNVWVVDKNVGNKRLLLSLPRTDSANPQWIDNAHLLILGYDIDVITGSKVVDKFNEILSYVGVRLGGISPSGEKMAYSYGGWLVVYNKKTDTEEIKIESQDQLSYLSFSFDERKIVYVSGLNWEFLKILDLDSQTTKTINFAENGPNFSIDPDAIIWTSDSKYILVSNYRGIYLVDIYTGEMRFLASGRLEPSAGQPKDKILFQADVDSTAPCIPKSWWVYQTLWVMSSGKNLTAELTAVKSNSQIALRGTASDLHFEAYKIEYASLSEPNQWFPVVAYSDAPVLNELFTTWIPPSEGIYYVQLTAWDKAGNVATNRQRISWGDSPTDSTSVTNFYKSVNPFSPNGDGVKDAVELHYKVLRPVHLDFYIYDENNNLLRSFSADHSFPVETFITWDGKDDAGKIMPDGKYKFRVFDLEFAVEIDNTPPDVLGYFGAEGWSDPPVRLFALAIDKSFKEWKIETSDRNSVDKVWEQAFSGIGELATYDITGAHPVDLGAVSVGQLTGKDFRIIGEDTAGNRRESTFTSDEWISVSSSLPIDNKFQLTALETIINPIQYVVVQWQYPPMPFGNGPWNDDQIFLNDENTLSEQFSLIWDYSRINLKPILFRVKAVDINRKEFFSGLLGYGGGQFFDPAKRSFLMLSKITPPSPEDPNNYTLEGFHNLEDKEWTLNIDKSPAIKPLQWTTFQSISLPSAGIFKIKIDKRYFELCSEYYVRFVAKSADSTVTGNFADLKIPCIKFSHEYAEAQNCGALSQKVDVKTTINVPDLLGYELVELSIGVSKSSTHLINESAINAYRVSSPVLGHEYSATVDVSSLPAGPYYLFEVLKYRNHDLETDVLVDNEIATYHDLLVDATLPTVRISYPGPATSVCPTKVAGQNGAIFTIPIQGVISDSSNIKKYEVYYGYGEGDAFNTTSIRGTGQVQGEIGTWTLLESAETSYSLKLQATDGAGNTGCFTTSFSVDKDIEIADLAADKKVFSVNGNNTVSVQYTINEYAAIDVKVFKLSGSVLDSTLIRTINSNLQHLNGMETAVWDGKNDSGLAVPDGRYGIVVSPVDSCGNAVQKWVAVEVDNTAPAAVITYPKPGDLPGIILEVKGTADDLHFSSSTLEAGQGDTPGAWTQIASLSAPVKDGILGQWNTYGLEGKWTLRLTATDSTGNTKETRVTLDLGTRQNLIKALEVTPKIFSPNNDGMLDVATTSYELADTCDVTIDFIDAGGIVRKTYNAQSLSAGVHTRAWDGTDSAGAKVVDSAYSIRLTAVLSRDTSVNHVESTTVITDTTVPMVDIKQFADNASFKNSVAVNGTISDQNFSEYTVSYTGALGTTLINQANQSRDNYTFGTLNDLAEGSYTLTVKARDLAENIIEKTIPFTVDRTAPVVKLDSPKDDAYYGADRNSIAITGSIIEKNLETYSLRYAQGASPSQWTEVASGSTIPANAQLFTWNVGIGSGLADGLYTLSLYAKDKAGSESEARAKVTIDNMPPQAAITSPQDGTYVKAATDIRGTASDQNFDTYKVEISEGQCSSAYKWAIIKAGSIPVTDGILANWQALPSDNEYCIRLTALDKLGGKAEAKVGVKVDTHPPAAPVLSGSVDNRVNAQLSWTCNSEPDVAGYNIYRNGQKINAELVAGCEFRDQNLAAAAYTYAVKAIDLAGWESQASKEFVIKIDLTGPDASIRSPQDGARLSGVIDIKGMAYSVDDFKQYRVYIGQGTAPSSWTLLRTSPMPILYGSLAQWDTLGISEGPYSIKLETEDISGNINIYQITVLVDTSAPNAPVLVSAADTDSNITLTWSASAEADDAGYLLFRNDQLVNVASGTMLGDLKPYLLSCNAYIDKYLPDGTFRYYVVAVDQAGNMSSQSNAMEVFLDTHAPRATIVDPADRSIIGNTMPIKAKSPDFDIASMQFQIQSAQTSTWTDLGSPVTTSPYTTYLDPSALGLAYGDYRLRAVATDQGQKSDASPGYITVTYADLLAPAAPQEPTTRVNGGTITISWTVNAEGDLAGYNVYRTAGGTRTKLNAALIAPSQQPAYQDSGLADGTYIYDVTAVDTHNNESIPSSQTSAKIYTPEIAQPYTPTAQNVVQLQGANLAANGTVSVFLDTATGLVSMGTATADAMGAFDMNASLTPGENRFSARVTDSAGNISKDSSTVVVVYDVAPGAPTGLAASVDESTVHLAWNANPEPGVLGYNAYRDGVKANKSEALVMLPTSVTGSSSLDPYLYAPAAADDSSLDSYWAPASGVGAASPAWWETDLPAQELINHVEIHWGTDVDASGSQVIYAGKDYEVQVWSGYAWITQAKVVGNAAKDNIFDFKPSYRTNRIRIFITDSTDINSAKQVRLAEITISKDTLIPKNAQPSYDDLNLMNKQYGYRVTAVDNYGFESGLSSEATATVSITPPDRPASLGVSATPEGGLNASWTYSGSAPAGYSLYRGLTSGGPYSKVNSAVTSGTSYLDMGLLSGVTYYYVVVAVDAAGNEGAYSNEASGTPHDTVPPSKPVICFPAITGLPVTLSTNKTDIYGIADPGSTIDFFGNGAWRGRTVAQPNDSVRNVPLNYDQLGAAISPDGKTLVYSYNSRIWLTSFATGIATQILQISGSSTFAWSFDSKKIAYTFYDSTGRRRIGIYDVPSGSSAPLTSDIGVSESYPSWSPDGSKMAYVQSGGASAGVKIRDLLSGVVVQAINSSAAGHPVFSPDGKKIAYFDSVSLKLYDSAGNLSQLIDANTDATALEWSPDGSALAFVSNRNGSGDVYVLDIPSGNQIRVPGSGGRPHYLAWTADGKYVLFDLWNSSKSRDTLWMADFRAQTPPQQIMPDLLNVWYAGSAKTGALAFIDRNAQGAYNAHLLNRAGSFSLDSVSLTPGENMFIAEATDATENLSDPSDAISVTFDTRSMPDLTVSPDDVSLYPPYPVAGEQMAFTAVVSNTGQTDVSNVDVAVYVWNALGQSELLKTDRIPVLGAGSSALISGTWDSAGKTGRNSLVVVIDPDDTIPEPIESNNIAIKDFYVADHAGMSMNTETDAAQYGSSQNANLAVTVWNTGPAADALLEAGIEDANGNPVLTYETRTISLAYGTRSIQNFVWNTGSTFAGSYIVHTVLRDAAGARLAENTKPFTVIPDAAVDLSVATTKTAYGPGENVVTSFTIRNAGANYIIPALQAAVSITNAAGTSVFSEVKNISNLMPGSSVDLSSSWNTGLAAPGNYHTVVTVSFDGGTTVSRSAAFGVNALMVLTGNLTASPSVVPAGNSVQLTYTVANAGNTDAPDCTARISIIDPETQTVIQTLDEIVDLAENSTKSGQVMVSTNGYGLKTYTAILQSVYQGTTKNIANASFTVKDLTPPVVTVITPAANATYSNSITISVLAADNASGVENVDYQLDTGPWRLLATADPAQGRYSTTWNPTLAENGHHAMYFRATDKAGNTGTPVPVLFTVQTDTTPPVLTLSTLPDGAYTNNATLNITGTVTDDTAVQGVTINASAVAVNADGAFSHAISLLTGTNAVATIATDTAGNTATDTRTIILDQSVPAITITSPADNSITNQISSTVTGTVGKAATVSVTVNGISSDPSVVSDATFSFPVSLVYGQNTIQVTATDLAGNTGTAKRTVTLDNQNPSLSVVYPAEDITTNQNQISLTGQVSDLTPVMVTVSVDGNVYTPIAVNGSFAQTISFTVQKTYQINVTAVDEAGNRSSVQRNVIYNAIPRNFGVFGATGVSISGGYVDSYDSTRGAYDGVRGSSVSVGTNSAANRAINLSGGAAVYGDVYAGPGGDPAKAITTSGGAIIYGTDGILSMLKDMTPVSDPGGGASVSFKNDTTLTSGAYRVSSINLSGGGIGTIDGSVTLYVTGGLSLSGGAQIVILPGGSLTIYLGGKLNVSGGAIVNKALDPHRLSIYGTNTCSAVNYSGNSAFYGVIYAPTAKTSISGGNDIYGSVIGSSVNISGGAAVHYDESL